MCGGGGSGREGGGGSTSNRGQQVVDISRDLVEDARSNIRSAGDDSDRKAAATRRAVSQPKPPTTSPRPDTSSSADRVVEISQALTRGADKALSFGRDPTPTPFAPQQPLSFGQDLGSTPTPRFDLGDENIFGDLALENMPYNIGPSEEQESKVREAARKAGVDEDLFARVVGKESSYDPEVWSGERRSSAGAIGPAQLMPGTASDLGVDPYDVEENLLGGARYLRQQLDRFKTPELALAAYNAGPGNVEKYGGVPPFEETQDYVDEILRGRTGSAAMFAEEEPVAGPIRPAPRPDALVAEQALRQRGTPTQQGGIMGMGLGPRGTATYQNLSPVEKGVMTVAGQFLPGMNLASGIGFRLNDRELRAAADMLAGEYEPRQGILGFGADPEFVRVEPVVNELTGETVGAMGYDAEGNPVLYRGQRQGVRYTGPGSELVEVPRYVSDDDGDRTQAAPSGKTRDTAPAPGGGTPAPDEYVPPVLEPFPERPSTPYTPPQLSPYTPSQGQGLEALLPYPYGRPTGLSRLQL